MCSPYWSLCLLHRAIEVQLHNLTFTQSTGYITVCSIIPAPAPASMCDARLLVGRDSYSASPMFSNVALFSAWLAVASIEARSYAILWNVYCCQISDMNSRHWSVSRPFGSQLEAKSVFIPGSRWSGRFL